MRRPRRSGRVSSTRWRRRWRSSRACRQRSSTSPSICRSDSASIPSTPTRWCAARWCCHTGSASRSASRSSRRATRSARRARRGPTSWAPRISSSACRAAGWSSTRRSRRRWGRACRSTRRRSRTCSRKRFRAEDPTVPTQAKVDAVAEFRSRLDGVKTVVLTEYRGLTVQQLSDLRKQLRAVSAEYKIIKNRLARLAIKSSRLEQLGAHLTGPTGVVFSKEDPVALAKTLHTFAKAHQALAIKAGYVEGPMPPPAQLRALADLPSREQLRAQLVGAIQGILVQLVCVLTAPQRELVYILQQRGKNAAE